MVKSIKFSKSEKVILSALSVIAVGASATIVAQNSATPTHAMEFTSGDQVLSTVNLTDGAGNISIDLPAVANSVQSSSDESASSSSVSAESQSAATENTSGDVSQNVKVKVDGKTVDPADFADHGVSINTDNTGTLDGSENTANVNVDRTSSSDQTTSVRQHQHVNVDVNIGHNKVSGNKNPVTVTNGSVNVNFSLPK